MDYDLQLHRSALKLPPSLPFSRRRSSLSLSPLLSYPYRPTNSPLGLPPASAAVIRIRVQHIRIRAALFLSSSSPFARSLCEPCYVAFLPHTEILAKPCSLVTNDDAWSHPACSTAAIRLLPVHFLSPAWSNRSPIRGDVPRSANRNVAAQVRTK